MPQTYAHQYFGDRVYSVLPEEIREVIYKEKDLFNIGLQGPDILFYYHPLKKNKIVALGDQMHEWDGEQFFRRALSAMSGGEFADAERVYLYGVLCHFTLDSICHPYIIQYDEQREGVTHSVIEGDFDRLLIEKNGRNPVEEDMVADFHPTGRSASVITRFYVGVPMATIHEALRSFVKFHQLLRCSGNGKRQFLYTALRVLGKYDSLRGHITAPWADPLCAESSAHLEELFESAIPRAATLIAGFSENLNYDLQYHYDFLGRKITK